MKIASALLTVLLFTASAFALPPPPPAGPYDTCGEPAIVNNQFVIAVWAKAMVPAKWEFLLGVKLKGQVQPQAVKNIEILKKYEGRPVHVQGYLVDLGNNQRGYVPMVIDDGRPCH